MVESEQKKLTLVKHEEKKNKYAKCLVNIKALGVKTYSYIIPEQMQDKIKIGQALLVPFGRPGLSHAFFVGFPDFLPE